MGIENKVADALSRVPICHALSVVRRSLMDEVKFQVQNDQFYSKILDSLKENPHIMYEGNFHLYMDNLYFQSRLCIPFDSHLKDQIMHDCHNTPFSGHLGLNKTYLKIKQSFFWPNMKQGIQNFVRECLLCQQVKVEQKRTPGQM